MTPDEIFAKFSPVPTTTRQTTTTGLARSKAIAAAQATDSQSLAGQKAAMKGGFIQQHLNMIGGGAGATGGALAGAAGGAALGSVVPIVGTAAGGIIGGILGAAAGGAGGGALGEATKQSLEGNYGSKQAGKEVGKQALIQGALGAGGEGAGAVVGHLLPAAGEGGGAITNALRNLSGKKVAQQIASNLPKDAIQTSGDLARLGSNSELMSGLGLFNNADRSTAAGIANDFIGGVKNTALSNAGPVPALNGLNERITAAITDNGVNVSDAAAIRGAVRSAVDKAVTSSGSIGSQAVDASKVFDIQRNLETLGQNAFRSGDAEKAAAYKDMAQHFAGLIDSHTGANGAISAMQVPEAQAAALTDRAVSALGKTKGQALADHLIEGVNRAGHGAGSAGGMADVRDLLSSFVPANKAATSAAIGAVQGGAPGLVESAVPAAVSPFGKLGAIRSLLSHADAPVAAAAGKAANLTGGIGQLVSKGTDAALTTAPAIPAAIGALEGSPAQASASSSSTPGVLEGSQIAQDQNATPDSSQTSDGSNAFSPEALQAMAINDIHQTGGKNIDKIATLAGLFGPNGKTSASSGTTAQKNQQLASNNALSVLDNVEKQFSDAGGGQGFGLGHLAEFGTKFNVNPNLKAYGTQLTDAATALAKAITGSARPAASVIAQYRNSLPQASDSPAVAAKKLQNLRETVKGLQTSSTTQLQPTDSGGLQ